jgi:hypothetical protein
VIFEDNVAMETWKCCDDGRMELQKKSKIQWAIKNSTHDSSKEQNAIGH